MAKGRKAEPGTHEAREYIQGDKFLTWLNQCQVSDDAKRRIKKAIYFGLGVKLEAPKEIIKEELNNEKGIDNSGDEYFALEDRQIVE